MSILFSDDDAYKFERSNGSTSHGHGKVVADATGTRFGPRHEYWAKDLTTGANYVSYEDTSSPSGDPASVGWERSFGSSIPSSSTIEGWIRAYYQAELDGKSWTGLNLHTIQIDPGGHSLELNSSSIGHVDVYDYAYGAVVMSVEHWWLKSGVSSPVLHRSNNKLELTAAGSAPGSATSPSAPTGFTFAELILVVVL